MTLRYMLLGVAVSAIALAPVHAQEPAVILNISVLGTLGPVLEGSDPLGANGHNGVLSVQVSESATPFASTANFAAYSIPAGSVTSIIGNTRYTTNSPAKMTISLSAAGDTLIVVYDSENGTATRFVATLAPGSFSRAVLMHPEPFSPSPQHLTPAVSAGGPGSQLWYSDAGALTVLGLSGSISSATR